MSMHSDADMNHADNEPVPATEHVDVRMLADAWTLRQLFGNIDIYLFDQLLKGRIQPGARILDAGCGSGRNLVYFLRTGFDVYGVDGSDAAIVQVLSLARGIRPDIDANNFRVESLDVLSFENAFFDVVLSNAVLHFVENERQFQQQLHELWRVLKQGGLLLCRLASSIGLEKHIRHISGRRYWLPDGSRRFLVDEAMLLSLTSSLKAELVEPIKTTNVQNLRCMTTWCLRKR